MKKLNIAILSLLLMGGCIARPDIVIEDFESDGGFDQSRFGAWTVEGNAFSGAPAEGGVSGQNDVSGFSGEKFANSFHGGDDPTGILLSYEFTIQRKYINFLMGGGNHPGTFIELLVDGESRYRSAPLFPSEQLNSMSWDVSDLKGQKARIQIVDEQTGGWGHTLVDQIEMSDKDKSLFQSDHTVDLTIDKKYVLLPIQDDAREYNIAIEVDGEQIMEPIMVRLAEERIDYWMPLDVEKYKGKSMSLHFDYVFAGAVGLDELTQSDSFNFNYNEPYRPDFHFSPPYGWTNDPNGMFYKDGEYHLYYQYNPYGTRWGNMHWGHAVSKDLCKWKHMPVAIAPDHIGAIFSGSAVVDKNNTAGFGRGAVVAIYTSHKGYQVQSISYSTDNGTTFTSYENNPVLADPGYKDFRDTKVRWHEPTSRWIMTLATYGAVIFYESKDLKTWNKLSEFGEGMGAHGGVWECPDLFPIDYNGTEKWVLLVSINPGAPNGGCATQYFIGDFDGHSFKADTLPYPLWVDYGCDNYAGVTWNNVPDERTLFIGWMSNHDYANFVPTHYFRNSMTVPREMKLMHNGKHVVLGSFPVKELEGMRSGSSKVPDAVVKDTHLVEGVAGMERGIYDMMFTLTPSSDAPFGFTLLNDAGEKVVFTFDKSQGVLTVNRAQSGNTTFHPKFYVDAITSPLSSKNSYDVRLLIDKASSELFVNGGEVVQSNIFFPSAPFNKISFNSAGGNVSLSDMTVYEIK
jgi:fructan beta-fructosidase